MFKSLKKIVILTLLLIVTSLMALTVFQTKGEASTGWSRPLEPVVLKGIQVTGYSFVDINQIFAFSYKNGQWEQIPFQIDEINMTGVYAADNGYLDPNDDLVFMAKDLGEKVGEGNWIPDADSRNYRRYEIEVTNPLDTDEVGYVYLYRSSTLTKSSEDYVSWDEETSTITAGTYEYVLGETFIGFDGMELNGNEVDVLDRSKIRLSVVCRLGGDDYPIPPFTEETYSEDIEDFLDLDPTNDGLVRVGGGTKDLHNWYYDSMHLNKFFVDFNVLNGIVCEAPGLNFGYIDTFRFSFDWLDPTDTGMETMTYYDDETADGVEIDGLPDSILASPIVTLNWDQASGALGSVVRVAEIDSSITSFGEITNYYQDDASYDDGTGDLKSFGDSGIQVTWLPTTPEYEYGTFTVAMTSFILDPDQPNIGDTYAGYLDDNNALQTVITSQEYKAILYFPIVFK